MKLQYDPESDSLYIELAEARAVDSRELSEGVVSDFDEAGTLVGLDIEHAATKVDLQRFTSEGIPHLRNKVA